MIIVGFTAAEWLDVGRSTGLFLIGIVTAWSAWRQSKTAKTVDVIHTLTNSAMGLQKRQLAEVTAAKAAITKDPADITASEAALADYLDHVAKQSKADSKS